MRTLRPRGFLLVDIMIGGALAAVALAGVLTVLASARAKNVAATRDVVATQLVLEKIDQVRSQPFASISTGTTTEATVAGMTGKYSRTTLVNTTGSPDSIGGFSIPFKNVIVTVTFPSEGKTRSTQATTRVYQ